MVSLCLEASDPSLAGGKIPSFLGSLFCYLLSLAPSLASPSSPAPLITFQPLPHPYFRSISPALHVSLLLPFRFPFPVPFPWLDARDSKAPGESRAQGGRWAGPASSEWGSTLASQYKGRRKWGEVEEMSAAQPWWVGESLVSSWQPQHRRSLQWILASQSIRARRGPIASVQPPPIFQPGMPKPDTGSSLPRRGGCFLKSQDHYPSLLTPGISCCGRPAPS